MARKKRHLSKATRRKISKALKGKKRGPRKGTPKKVYEKARRARLAYEKAAKTTKPFQKGGKRFKAIVAAAKARGAKNPEAVAAAIMWKKYGKTKKTVAKIKKNRVRKSAHPGRGYISAKKKKTKKSKKKKTKKRKK